MRCAILASVVVIQTAWAQSTDLSTDERVVLFPTLGHRVGDGRTWSIDIHGWIFEEGWTDLSLRAMEKALDLDDEIANPADRARLRQRVKAFVVDNERGERISFTIGGRRFTVGPSAVNGHFRGRIELPAEEAAAVQTAPGGRKSRLVCRLDTPAGDSRVFTGRVHLLETHGLSVISDIDDTVRVTHVKDRKAMLRNTFLRSFQPVPGMPEVYAHWARVYGAEFHYVSASPYQLYEPLAEFMAAGGLPEGTFHLKSIRLKDPTVMDLFDPAEEFKPGRIEPILERFPERVFVCVGDSGEKDPEVYGELAREYPQIRRILIRNVTGEGPDSPRYERAFRGLAAESWKIFNDPAQIRDLGLPERPSSAPSPMPGTAPGE